MVIKEGKQINLEKKLDYRRRERRTVIMNRRTTNSELQTMLDANSKTKSLFNLIDVN